LLTFQLRGQWFCLPLVLARRVISGPADAALAPAGLTQLQQDNIPLIDTATLIYQEAPPSQGDTPTTKAWGPAQAPVQTVLVIDPPPLGAVGLLIDSTPSIRRAKQSAFSPVPAIYLIMNRLQGINTLVTLGKHEPPHFLLEVDALLAKLTQN